MSPFNMFDKLTPKQKLVFGISSSWIIFAFILLGLYKSVGLTDHNGLIYAAIFFVIAIWLTTMSIDDYIKKTKNKKSDATTIVGILFFLVVVVVVIVGGFFK